MLIFKQIADIQQYLKKVHFEGQTIGFVPTMGALHQGHLSLIRLAQQKSAIVICSIFVNPTQFNDAVDFDKYPISIGQDIALLEKAGNDILFLPSVVEIYPTGQKLNEPYKLGEIESLLEGHFRPGHYQGVCQVVDRLVQIIRPAFLFLGQKDFQQVMVIKKMLALKKHAAEVIIGPTLRDENGLALSSRNLRLNEEQKINAQTIHQCLLYIKNNISKLGIPALKEEAQKRLRNNGFDKIDYIEICKTDNLATIITYDPTIPSIILIAAYIGNIRLIDNILI